MRTKPEGDQHATAHVRCVKLKARPRRSVKRRPSPTCHVVHSPHVHCCTIAFAADPETRDATMACAPTICILQKISPSPRVLSRGSQHTPLPRPPPAARHTFALLFAMLSPQAHRNSSLARATLRPFAPCSGPSHVSTPHTAQHTPFHVCDGPHCIGIGSPAPCCHSDRVSLPMGRCGSSPTTRLRSFSRR